MSDEHISTQRPSFLLVLGTEQIYNAFELKLLNYYFCHYLYVEFQIYFNVMFEQMFNKLPS